MLLQTFINTKEIKSKVSHSSPKKLGGEVGRLISIRRLAKVKLPVFPTDNKDD